MTSIVLIVPTETEQQRKAAAALRVRLAPAGYSEYEGRGVWRGLVEQHVRIEVFAEDVSIIRAYHYEYGTLAREHTLARIVDGRPEFVTVSPPVKLSPLAAEIVAQNREE